MISFGISVKECKFTELFIWHRPQGILKVINVSCIRIVVNCIQILYTNKTVRLYYSAPTMRNDSETVIRTIARACPEESISWSQCFLDIVEREMVSRSYKPVKDGRFWSVSHSRRRYTKPVFTGFPLQLYMYRIVTADLYLRAFPGGYPGYRSGMRNGSETVIRTIVRACLEESISWSHCFLDTVERWMVSRSYKPVKDDRFWSVFHSCRRYTKPVFTGFPLQLSGYRRVAADMYLQAFLGGHLGIEVSWETAQKRSSGRSLELVPRSLSHDHTVFWM